MEAIKFVFHVFVGLVFMSLALIAYVAVTA